MTAAAGRLAALLFALPVSAGVDPKAAPATGDYQVDRVASDPLALLAADDPAWAPSQRIVWGPPAYQTAFRALWNANGLFVRFDVTDPEPWHTLTQRDQRLWEEEVVEIFIDPAGARREYAEIEINPANVICDLWINAAERKGDIAWSPAGLESVVRPRSDADGRTTGWTAVAFFPWLGLAPPGSEGRPPQPGERWLFNVFRIERPGGARRPEQGALFLAWSPTGCASFHVPDAFRGLQFRDWAPK